MLGYIRARWGEVSTNFGLFGLAVALVMLVASFFVRFDIGQILRDIGKPLAAAGLIGIFMPDREAEMKLPSLPLSLFAGVQWKLLGITAGVLILIGSVTTTYAWFKGHKAGEAKIQVAWDLDAAKRDQAMNKLLVASREKTQVSIQDSNRISNDLVQTLSEAEAAVRAARVASDRRLRESEQRAAIYKRQSEAGPTERANLAGHAAELDRSLEEGRALVEEFRITLGQRDQEVILLGQQIMSDRKAVSD